VVVRELFTSPSFKKTAYFAAAFISTLLAAGACAVQLAIAGAAPIQSVLPAMLSVHALIGLAEGGLTIAALVILSYAVTKVATHRAWIVPLGFAAVIAVVISPFAATAPDGLETVAAALGLPSGTLLTAPFAEYAVPVVNSAMLSTALAGFLGVSLLFTVAYGTGRVLAQSEPKA
jgi:cobalt/nickel transport system permease protein